MGDSPSKFHNFVKAIIFILVGIVALRAACAEEPDVAKLEEGYKTTADALSRELAEVVKKADVIRTVLTDLYKSSEIMNDVTRRTERALKEPPAKGFASPARLQLVFVSNQPPSLKQDPQDLYNRFKSSVVVRIALLDVNLQKSSFEPVEVTIPVAASPTGKWVGSYVAERGSLRRMERRSG